MDRLTASKLTRRHFIVTAATAAGGFAIGFGIAPRTARAATVLAQPWNDDHAHDPNEIDAGITNICRCGTYERLRRAIHRAANLMKA